MISDQMVSQQMVAPNDEAELRMPCERGDVVAWRGRRRCAGGPMARESFATSLLAPVAT
jgi:hypothetical protein